MPLATDEFARRDAGGVETLAGPARLSWAFDGLSTGDKHVLRVRYMCGVRVADNPTDRRMFAQVLLSRTGTVSTRELNEHFGVALRAAAAQAASKRTAEQWTEGNGQFSQEMVDALAAAGRAVAFACGLELLGPAQLELSSPSLQQQKLEQIARARAEERAVGQVQTLQRAASVLKQFNELRAAAPDLPAGAILERLSPADRGEALQSLLLAAANETQLAPLWAVAGTNLVKIDPRHDTPRIETIALPENLGPLRSVQPATVKGERVLLVGARSGVMIVNPKNPGNASRFPGPVADSQLGYNSVALTGRTLWACHGDIGVVSWDLDDYEDSPRIVAPARRDGEASAPPAEPYRATSITTSVGSPGSSGTRSSRAPGPRNCRTLDDRSILYSVSGELLRADGSTTTPFETGSTSEIVAIVSDANRLFIVHEDGLVATLDRASLEITSRDRRGGKVCAAAALPWLGEVRLLLACDAGPIDCIGTSDSLVTRYASTHRALRVVTAAPDLVAALSSDRQRLILWNAADGRSPRTELHIAALTRHRVADVEFG